ncbi:flagellar basal body rod protein FlgC [Virgibacillus soli]|uniref:Flagellar basal-body rod protein FlgC n=1 Tax=Lederbergia galactosidilytica TaxID=217031 RepID=A0A0Q9XNQ6_9BACI|nr:flagellar basal body rod protein FlgC [Lederbergia galactosidilytica]KRG09757.1 flagellar basal body rod protein FlgC [Lederbergia galactosidilytica]KRG13485.1 flagellar basal body rod protein FlgC [Virgibacillus soli]MBP1913661.1 flagellar basal-body rod protein FlgC [Lederbergia galactosidilytica]
MSVFQNMGITSSALTTQRLRMDTIASNMANIDTTRGQYINGEWQPYTRKMVVMQPQASSFSSQLNLAVGRQAQQLNGVKATKIVEDDSPYRLEYNPDHPDANEDGYVELPNVDPLKEMVDLISATRSYEANVTVFDASKSMYLKALQIGK